MNNTVLTETNDKRKYLAQKLVSRFKIVFFALTTICGESEFLTIRTQP